MIRFIARSLAGGMRLLKIFIPYAHALGLSVFLFSILGCGSMRIQNRAGSIQDTVRESIGSEVPYSYNEQNTLSRDFQAYILANQPLAGDMLVALVAPDPELSRRAINAVLHLWENMNKNQRAAFIHNALTLKLRPGGWSFVIGCTNGSIPASMKNSSTNNSC